MNDKLWTGRFSKPLSDTANDYNASIHFDSRMYRQDIIGSMAHAAMLSATHIISEEDGEKLIQGLEEILRELENGQLLIDETCEDIHSFVEQELTRRLGDTGRRLHTARSRNDQVAVDVRLALRDEADQVIALLKELIGVIVDKARAYESAIMPGYTHLQRAQPITFGHHLMAYAMMFLRDIGRMKDARGRMNVCPLGSGALAGTTFPIDRTMTAGALGFSGACVNSIDGVSDRDFCVEFASAIALIMTHLSRFSEEIILWCSWEFRFVELDDAYSTGSSIMPQKKNPDIAELTRGKAGRAVGNLVTLLTMLKGLPLAYNKDMQEDKEAIFDSFDTVEMALRVFSPMLATMRVKTDNMRKAAAMGFINATDCADYLVGKGLPFRSAYKATGALVAYLIECGKTLEDASLEDYRRFCDLFDEDVYEAINLENCVKKRTSLGATAPEEVARQIHYVELTLKAEE
ncbi:MAG: argininosuccinate lyase [Clostridia bacterium]|nr:argininosuccinate lyase [Clostridia bacterium]